MRRNIITDQVNPIYDIFFGLVLLKLIEKKIGSNEITECLGMIIFWLIRLGIIAEYMIYHGDSLETGTLQSRLSSIVKKTRIHHFHNLRLLQKIHLL